MKTTMVKHFQSVISKESKEQHLAKEGKLPTAVIACCGGGSNAIGSFANYLDDKEVRLIGVEPDKAASIKEGTPGNLNGFRCIVLQDAEGNPLPTYSIAAGLDYPGVGPEHSYLHTIGRAEYVTVSNEEVLDAFQTLSKVEGIIPALESSHAVAHAMRLAKEMKTGSILINLSGRGDKDMDYVIEHYGIR